MPHVRLRGQDGYPRHSEVKGQIDAVLKAAFPDWVDGTAHYSLDVLRGAIRPAREQAGLETSGIELGGEQTEELLVEILELREDVTVIVIRIDGQCYCANLKDESSPSLKLRRALKVWVAERQARLDQVLDGRVQLLLKWGDLHVDCDHQGQSCVPVTQNDQRNWGEQSDINDALTVRVGRDVSVVHFAYGANQRDAHGLPGFCRPIVNDSGNIVKLAIPHHVHAGHLEMPTLECSRFFYSIPVALDHALSLALAHQDYDLLEFDYQHDYEIGLAAANIQRKYETASLIAKQFESAVAQKGDSFSVASEWLLNALSAGHLPNVEDTWAETRRLKELVADGASIADLLPWEQRFLNRKQGVRLGSNGFEDGTIVSLSVEESIRREAAAGKDRMHRCLISSCSRSFIARDKLQEHLNTHTGARPHVCSVCNATFRDTATLRLHKLTHRDYDEREHGCDYPGCDKRFNLKADLERHERTHTGEKPYACTHPGCGKSFVSKPQLQTHLVSHSNDKPWKCPECPKAYGLRHNMEKHRKKHQNKRQRLEGQTTLT